MPDFQCSGRKLAPRGDLDLEAELRTLSRLPALGGPRGQLARRPPRLYVRWSDRPGGIHGEADRDAWVVYLRLRPDLDRFEIRETSLHELVHLSSSECWHHRAPFRRRLAQAAFEAWGVDVRDFATRASCCALDEAIVAELRAREDTPIGGLARAARSLFLPRLARR